MKEESFLRYLLRKESLLRLGKRVLPILLIWAFSSLLARWYLSGFNLIYEAKALYYMKTSPACEIVPAVAFDTQENMAVFGFGAPKDYKWIVRFGDGNYLTAMIQHDSSLEIIPYAYRKPGSYLVTVVFIDDARHCASQKTIYIKIEPFIIPSDKQQTT